VGLGPAEDPFAIDFDRGRRVRVRVGWAVSVTLGLRALKWPPVYGGAV
jgi:hypothetical protein